MFCFRFSPVRLLAVILISALLGACEGMTEKEFTSDDDCADCPPGLFSGEDGAMRWEW